jgi:hypothetical protein
MTATTSRGSSCFSAIVAVAALACSTRSKPIAVFPGADVLEEIGAHPAALPRSDEGPLPASGWTVELGGPPPSAWQTAPADTPAEKGLVAALAAQGKQARLTAALQCVAREFERFIAQAHKAPPVMLREFIAGACGATTASIAYQSSEATVEVALSDDEVSKRASGSFGAALASKVPARNMEVGFAFVRRGTNVRGVLVYAPAVAGIDPFVPVPDDSGEVTLSGRVNDEVQYVSGFINQGRYGVARCFVDPTLMRPRWKVTCPMAADDEVARIDLIYARPGRVLALPLLHTLVRRADATKLSYRPASFPGLPAATSAAEFAGAVITTLNRVRAEANLPLVRLATAQSATAARVAPTYFSAAFGERSADELETIALGLLAGWNISAMIRDGTLVSNYIPTTRDPNRWLAATLERPSGRLTLMAPEIEEVALGPVLSTAPEASGAVVVGYQFHHGAEHAQDIRRLSARLVLARRKRALSLPSPLAGMDAPLQQQLALVHEGKKEPLDALNELLETGVQRTHVPMRGYLVETTSLDALTMPEEILAQPNLQFQIGVTHHKPKGAAWAQFVIIVIFADAPDTKV